MRLYPGRSHQSHNVHTHTHTAEREISGTLTLKYCYSTNWRNFCPGLYSDDQRDLSVDIPGLCAALLFAVYLPTACTEARAGAVWPWSGRGSV
ncbi:hypothetical protein RRG08_063636 [Elysia crispata]|uniref:Uncharacterized protein n=1 Tax=Elysia crispata TaxID=231223 RepID=A0AAE1BDM0_9GAST|nr:hypothetical protein RRG08_063636 [Elysia crispata]